MCIHAGQSNHRLGAAYPVLCRLASASAAELGLELPLAAVGDREYTLSRALGSGRASIVLEGTLTGTEGPCAIKV